jgi:hypothetical protein
MATKKFTREELPVGSIIEIAVGWQYRPEGWKSTGSRPDNVTTLRIIIDADWWGSYSERAFNISMVGNSTNSPKVITISRDELANTIFKIIVPSSAAPEEVEPDEPYVEPGTQTQPETPTPETPDQPDNPGTGGEVEDTTVYVKSSNCDSKVVTINGKEYRALSLDYMDYVKNGYYYSDKQGASIYETGTSGTPAKFFATKIFADGELPTNAVIWVASGWQYRPEGWKHTGTRPGNITTTYVTMDDTWWGKYTQRGFNISMTSGGSLTGYTEEQIHEVFKIYIPVENIID